MEININEANSEKAEKDLFFHKFLNIIIPILIIIILGYIIYFIERYLLFFPIYFLIKIIIKIFYSYIDDLDFFLNILSIIIVLILQIFLLKIIILSVIFLSGGIFARFKYYEIFKDFINEQRTFAIKSINYLYDSSPNFAINYLIKTMNEICKFQKAFNNLKNIKNSSFEIKEYHFGDYLNEIITQYNKYKQENYNSKEITNKLIENLKQYQINLEHYTKFSYIDIITKFKYIQSLQLFEELMLYSFKNRKCFSVKISDDFSAYIIYPEIKNSDVKTLVIFCGQNAFFVEKLCLYQNNIQFYLNIKELTILVWNYKGFGLRSGFPSFNSIEKDVEELREYIDKYYKDYKIIIHGISIGGYPAIKLKNILNNNKNVCLIADRTYADMDLLAGTYVKYGKILYNIFFPKFLYKSDNIQNYIDIPIGNKIIFFDENDKIIDYSQSSLINNLTKKYYSEIILPKISNYNQYKNIINIFAEKNNLHTELRRVKNYSKANKLNENTLLFIKNLNKNINNIENFLMYFLVFGYPFNIKKEINYDKITFAKNYINFPEIMRKMVENNKNIFNNNLKNLISDLNFLFIKSNLNIPFNDEEIINFNYNNDNNEFSLQEGFQDNLMKYFGYVHRISCGHNGILKDEDEKYLKKYLIINQFISDSNDDDDKKSEENKIDI